MAGFALHSLLHEELPGPRPSPGKPKPGPAPSSSPQANVWSSKSWQSKRWQPKSDNPLAPRPPAALSATARTVHARPAWRALLRLSPGRWQAIVSRAAVTLAATVAVAGLVVAASFAWPGASPAPAPTVDGDSALAPTLVALAATAPAPDSAELARQIRVWPRVSGTVERVLVSPGQHVRRGDLLFTLDATDHRRGAELKAAEVAEKEAQLRLAVAREATAAQALLEGKASASRLQAATTAVAVARARLRSAVAGRRMALDQIRYTAVQAPCDGRIVTQNLQPGEPVVAGTAAPPGAAPPLVLASTGPGLELLPRASVNARRSDLF